MTRPARKKILIDARFWGRQDTGLGRYTQNLVQELVKISPEDDYYLLVRTKGVLDGLEKWPGNYQALVTPAHPYALKAQGQFLKALFKVNPDLVHVPHGGLPVMIRGKLVLTVHDLIKQSWSDQSSTTRNPIVHRFKLGAYQWNLNQGLKKASLVIVPSQQIKTSLEKRYPWTVGKVRVVYEGVDPVFFKPFNKDAEPLLSRYQLKKPFVIYTGNLYPYKNVPCLVEAVRLARARMPRLTLALVCARSVFKKRLSDQLKREGKQDLVRFLEDVSDQELAGLYHQALAFVSASWDEGFGITPLEALATGCPALVSAIPVFEEICQDLAVYFDPSQPESLTNLLVDLDQGKIKRAKRLSRDKYRWDKMAEETLKIYEQVLG